jgi:putative acetyltransferase
VTAAADASVSVSVDDPRRPEVRALLQRHLDFCQADTVPEHSFALDVAGLLDPTVTFVSCRDGDTVLGVAAIKELGAGDVELKSMHTAVEARGRGVGRVVLGYLLDLARARGYQRVLLETGTTPGYAAARSLYEAAGFVPVGPFGGYPETGDNCFYALTLYRPAASHQQ